MDVRHINPFVVSIKQVFSTMAGVEVQALKPRMKADDSAAVGVPLRTAQAAMRHSKPDLTANVYTDPKLLDIAGALDVLPSLPLDADDREAERSAATGTEDVTGDGLAPTLAPNLRKASISGTLLTRTPTRQRSSLAPMPRTQVTASARENRR